MTNLKTYSPPSQTLVPNGSELFAERAIDLNVDSDRGYMHGTTTMSKAKGDEAWQNYERIGEVRYSIARSARIAGYTVLRGERLNPSGTEIVDVAEAGIVADIVNGMYGKFGGTRGLVERFYTLMKVPADSYLISVREGGIEDGLWFLSPDEIDSQSFVDGRLDTSRGLKWITGRMQSGDTRSNFTRIVDPRDCHGRIWTPSKRFVDETDSPMVALNDLCEMLHVLTQSIMGRLRQRFALAGILLLPNEISDAAISGAPVDRQHSSDKVMNYLITIMTRNVTMHDQGMAQIPALLKGPADVLDKVRHIILDTQIAETDLKIRQQLIDRILDGLDQQKQAATGGESTNHWGMWAVSDEERRITVQPDIEAMCHALTKLILWPALLDRGWEPARVRRWRVGYDLSRASVKSNISDDARQAWDRGAVNLKFLRESIGASDDDQMDADEYVRWVGVKMQDPVLATYGLEGVEVSALPVRASSSNTPGPNPDSEGDEPRQGPGVGSPGSPNDRDSDAPRAEEPA